MSTRLLKYEIGDFEGAQKRIKESYPPTTCAWSNIYITTSLPPNSFQLVASPKVCTFNSAPPTLQVNQRSPINVAEFSFQGHKNTKKKERYSRSLNTPTKKRWEDSASNQLFQPLIGIACMPI